jgi:hypothetical protein
VIDGQEGRLDEPQEDESPVLDLRAMAFMLGLLLLGILLMLAMTHH